MTESVLVDSPRYKLLGPLRVMDGIKEIEVSSLSQRKILVSLLLSPGSVVSADALQFNLWGDDPPRTARKTLHTLVSRLRGKLGGTEIVTQPPGYLIEVDDAEVDSILFERLLADAGAALTEAPESALRLVDQALGLWSGAALAEFADEEFAMTEAHRLNELRLSATEIRFDAELALERYQSVIPELEAFASRHPFREKPRNRLMTALFRSGRAADALSVYNEFRRTMSEELGLDPSPELQELEFRILTQDTPPNATPSVDSQVDPTSRLTPIGGRLPQPPVLLGRRDELDRLSDMAQDALTTVIGPGGVGKTSLVSVWSETQPNVSIVELCDVRRSDDLVASITQQLGMVAYAGDANGSLIEGLSAMGGTLIIDNCESLLEPVRQFVADVMRLAPELRMVCTSRQRLGLPGEQVLSLEPLRVPQDLGEADKMRANEAIRLFLDRAHQADSAFRIHAEDLSTVAEICRRVNGLPLAIELAAARAPVFGVLDLAEQIKNDISVLEIGGGRHGSLARVLDWSIGLLDEETRRVLGTCAMFEGGFAIGPLTEVHGGGNVVVNIGRLVDASLAYRVPDSRPGRFKLHFPTRVHVRESIGHTPEELRRFVAWGHGFVSEVTRALGLPGESEPRKRLVAETQNVVAAAQTALESGDLAAAFEMGEMLGRADLIGSPSLAELLSEIAGSHVCHGEGAAVGVLAAAARSAAVQALHTDALEWAKRAEECASGRWHRGLYMATHARGLAAYFIGDKDKATEMLALVADDARVPLDERLVATFDQALVLGQAGARDDALTIASAAYDTAVDQTGQSVVSYALFVIGTIHLLDDPSRALESFDLAIDRARAADSGLIERISMLCRIISLMLLDRDDEAIAEIPILVDDLVMNGTHSLSLALVAANLFMRAGDVETAGLLSQAYESHAEAPRFGIAVNATKPLVDLRSKFTDEDWLDLGRRARELGQREVMGLIRSLATGRS